MVDIVRVSSDVLAHILADSEARVATKYISPSTVIKATRRTYKHRNSKRNLEIVVTVGRPNYLEREFIKKCQMVKEPFPVKKIQLKRMNGRF